MVVDYKSYGILQLMNIGKYLQKRNIFVLIEQQLTINQLHHHHH
jgi:hypothetical protein